MNDQYKAKAKELITSLYVQGNPVDYDAILSTRQVHKDLTVLLPFNSIDEFDVYEILMELYTPYYTNTTEITVKKNAEGEEKIIEKTREGMQFLWYLKRI